MTRGLESGCMRAGSGSRVRRYVAKTCVADRSSHCAYVRTNQLVLYEKRRTYGKQ